MSRIEVTVTASATEALLLEANLIKRLKPRYNVQLRDDKSFPYIQLPLRTNIRGSRFIAVRAADQTVLRSLSQQRGDAGDAAAAAEAVSRAPMRGYVLREPVASVPAIPDRRCRAPCVRLVAPEDYAQDVADTIRVLDGRNTEVIADLGRRMESRRRRSSSKTRHVCATRSRCSSTSSPARPSRGPRRRISTRSPSRGKAAILRRRSYVRGGRNLGSSNYFQRAGSAARRRRCRLFLAQYYLARGAPAEILVNLPLEDCDVLESALRERSGHAVRIRRNIRGTRARWLAMARTNAELGSACAPRAARR
jgi:excinuclease ABC subunit C